MNHEQQAINAAEQVLKDALEKQEKNTIKEHQTAMPYLISNAPEVLKPDALGTMGTHINLFTITAVPDAQPSKDLANPLQLEDINDAVVARFSHLHAFETPDEAQECLKNLVSSVMYNEGRKNNGDSIALFMSIYNQWFAMYSARKLTVSKRCGPDLQTNTASMTNIEDTPEQFFEHYPDMPKETRQTIIDLLFFAEAGRIMETKMPAVYKTMAKRVLNQVKDEDDNGE